MIFLLNKSYLAHFSTSVGAVHNSNYTMFEIGSYANRGLSQLVLTGETNILEQELANEVSISQMTKKKQKKNYFIVLKF